MSKSLVLAVVGAACVVAAGGGAYLAVRQNAVTAPGAAVGTQQAARAVPKPVAETEAIVARDLTPAPAEAVSPSSLPAEAPVARTARQPEKIAPSPKAPAKTASTRRRTTETTRTAKTEPAPVVERQISGSADTAAVAPALPPAPVPETTVPVREPDPMPSLPPVPVFEEVTVPADSVIGLQLETPVTSETARVEDRVEARVTRDVTVGGRIAVPAGSRVLGSITIVDKGGKLKERARLGIRFHTLVLADGTRVPLRTEPILREGESPARSSTTKVGGGAITGAVLGAIFGGGKGAAIGGTAGAAAGTAAVMAGERHAVKLAAGTTLTARLSEPATVTVEKQPE